MRSTPVNDLSGAQVARRRLLLASAAAAILAGTSRMALATSEPLELDWKDLVPEGSGTNIDALRQLGVVEHGRMSTPFDQMTDAEITTDYNGKLVRIPGYLVPLDLDGTSVKAGLLVPYVGACIHVPPPPPNQLIFVYVDTPYESQGLFEPVYVVGTFGAAATATQIAEVGYAMSEARIEPYP